MTEQEVLGSIKNTIREQMSMFGYDVGGLNDEQALERLGPACSSTGILLLGITGGKRPKTTNFWKYLEGMRARGLLIKTGHKGGQCKWWPTGFAEELRAKTP